MNGRKLRSSLTIRRLMYLDALARERHFRKAADACNVSQPTLSAAIGQLERDLGCQLVERSKCFERFTIEGEIVLARARPILAELKMLREAIIAVRKDRPSAAAV